MGDEMRLESKLIRGFVSRWLRKKLKAKLGYDVIVKMNEFKVTVIDDTGYVHLNLDAEIPKEELNRILDQIV